MDAKGIIVSAILGIFIYIVLIRTGNARPSSTVGYDQIINKNYMNYDGTGNTFPQGSCQ